MANKQEVLLNLFEKHIKGTKEQAIVVNVTVFLCHLTKTVSKVVNVESRAYVNTRVIKHLFDKKPAEEFDFLLSNIHKIVKYPDILYKNKNPKRGDFCFIKNIDGDHYLCSLEVIKNEELDCNEVSVVTAFRLRKANYLNNYELLWSWKDGIPSS